MYPLVCGLISGGGGVNYFCSSSFLWLSLEVNGA